MDQKHENAVVSAGSNDKTSDSGNDGRRLKRKRDSSPGPGLQTPSQKNRGDSGDLLPPMSPSQQGKYTLVIDMDGTILAELDQRPEIPIDFAVEQISTGKRTFILKRPGLEEFLQQVAELFEIVVFTESCKRRADVLLNMLENRGCIAHRLYRESCTEVFGKLAKDLSLLGGT
jgi:RNA polymerase II subunit A small phosphatase-like protein